MAELDAEPGDSATPAALALVVMITAFAAGALMLLIRPKPLRALYAISALVLMTLGAVPIAVLNAA